jgi:hypothetical protein
MSKKIGISILFGFFLLIGLFGITKVVMGAVVTADTVVEFYGLGNNSVYNSTVAKGGEVIFVNLTVVVDSTDGTTNYTNVTVSWDANNFTFYSFLDIDENQVVETNNSEGDSFHYHNVTLWADDPAEAANWNGTNTSTSSFGFENLTAADTLGANGSNEKLMIRFALLAASGSDSLDVFNVTLGTPGTPRDEAVDDSSIFVYVDGGAPDFNVINITDGNTTYTNTSTAGDPLNAFGDEENLTFPLSSESAITITVEVEELLPAALTLFYNVSADTNTNASSNSVESSGITFVETTTPQLGKAGIYTATISRGNLVDNGFLSFVFDANDSLNQTSYQNNSYTGAAVDAPFIVITNTTTVGFNTVNVTSAVESGQRTTLKSGDGKLTGDQWVSGNAIDITIEVANSSADAYGLDSVMMFYGLESAVFVNNSDYGSTLDERFGGYDGNILANKVVESTSDTTYNISTFPVVGNGSNTFSFILAANLSNNYTVIGDYSFKVDTDNPAEPTFTLPSSRTVGVSSGTGIKYTCTATDSDSGIDSYEWVLTKPSGTKVTKSTQIVTWSGSDIDQAGKYTLKCTVKDGVGYTATHTSTSTETFTATHSTTTSSGGSGGSGSGSAATVSFDVDLSKTSGGTIKAQQGRIKSFSFDGNTKHTITFDKVTATTVTVTIASNPITVNLGVGETKEVDVNADGISDMSVTLKSILNDVADIEIKEIEAGAKVVADEERAASGAVAGDSGSDTGTTSERTTPVDGGSNAGLWVTLLIIVAVIVVGYFAYKKK